VTYRISDAAGKHYTVGAEEFRRAANHEAAGLPRLTQAGRLKSGFVEVEMMGSTARIRGRGFGHGVGLYQWGAQAMANTRYRAEAIVAFYYPGAALTRLYTRPRQAAR